MEAAAVVSVHKNLELPRPLNLVRHSQPLRLQQMGVLMSVGAYLQVPEKELARNQQCAWGGGSSPSEVREIRGGV